MTDDLKMALNNLQLHIDSNREEVLLLFNNNYSIRLYRENRKKEIAKGELPANYLDNIICITIEDFVYRNALTGRKFKRYYFMVD